MEKKDREHPQINCVTQFRASLRIGIDLPCAPVSDAWQYITCHARTNMAEKWISPVHAAARIIFAMPIFPTGKTASKPKFANVRYRVTWSLTTSRVSPKLRVRHFRPCRGPTTGACHFHA